MVLFHPTDLYDLAFPPKPIRVIFLVIMACNASAFSMALGIRHLLQKGSELKENQKMDWLKRGIILSFLIVLSTSLVSVYALVYEEDTESMTQTILNANNFYDPNSDILTDWNVNGSDTHFGAIDDGVRNTSIPLLTDYIYTSLKKVDEIGFPTPNESNIETIILWVYSSTGSNAKTTINLKNEGITQATLTINPGSPQGWRSTVWENPGSIGTITVEFIHDKGEGAPTNSNVYAAYLEVIFNPYS